MNVSLKSSSPEEVVCDALIYFLTSDTGSLYCGDLAEIDWNLDGRISKGVDAGHFTFEGTGAYLFAYPRTIAVPHVIVIPSGASDRFDHNLDTIVEKQLLPALLGLGVQDLCVSLASFDDPSFLKEAVIHIARETRQIKARKLSFLLSLGRAKELTVFFKSKKLF